MSFDLLDAPDIWDGDGSQPPVYDAAVEGQGIARDYGILKKYNVCPTPKLRALLDEVLAAAAKHDQSTTEAHALANAIRTFDEYWDLLMSNPQCLRMILRAVEMNRYFLVRSLIQDYTKIIERDIVWPQFIPALLVGSPEQCNRALEATGTEPEEKDYIMTIYVDIPLEQMCIDVDHATAKLKAQAATEGRLQSKVHALVQQKDHKQLAHILTKDKELIVDLKAGGTISDLEYRVISKGISNIQQQNFQYMIDGDHFQVK